MRMNFSFFMISVFICGLCVAVDTADTSSSVTLGIKYHGNSTLPTLTLPYGTWRASIYDSVNDVCIQSQKVPIIIICAIGWQDVFRFTYSPTSALEPLQQAPTDGQSQLHRSIMQRSKMEAMDLHAPRANFLYLQGLWNHILLSL